MSIERYRVFDKIRLPKSELIDNDKIIARFKAEQLHECLRKYPKNDLAFVRFYLTDGEDYDIVILETDIGVIINDEEFRENTKLDEN